MSVDAAADVAAFVPAAVSVDVAAANTTVLEAAATNAVELFAAAVEVAIEVDVAVLNALNEPACSVLIDVTADVAVDVVTSEAVLAASWLVKAVLRVVVVLVNDDCAIVLVELAPAAAVEAVPNEVEAVAAAVDALL